MNDTDKSKTFFFVNVATIVYWGIVLSYSAVYLLLGTEGGDLPIQSTYGNFQKYNTL